MVVGNRSSERTAARPRAPNGSPGNRRSPRRFALSVGQTDADQPDDARLVLVDAVVFARRVAEAQEIDAAMHVPGSERAGDLADRQRHEAADVEESETIVDAIQLVVVA